MYEPNSFEENIKRPEKGKKVCFLPEDYVVIDLETTGLNPEKDEIIEIGAIRVRRLMITDTFNTLVYPQKGIDPFITRLTGITPEMVSDAPCISEALLSLMNFVKSDVVIGHNVHFDINFLYDKAVECFGHGFSNNYVDTMQLSRKLFPEYKHHKLCNLEERFCLQNAQAHRALSDVIVTNDAYQYMRKWIIEKGVHWHD